MLSPDSRTIAFELIHPPAGYQLDFAVLTAYTLDLEALLVLPLSVLAQPEGGLDDLLVDPLQLHQALRETGDRVHVFVDQTGIAIPRSARPLYSMLEPSVHPVRAPNGGIFHPKVWIARFTAMDETAEDLLRVAILSRNLTFDRSWDVALASEAQFRSNRYVEASRPLRDLLLALPQLATNANRMPQDVVERVETLADQVCRTAFPSPEGFNSPIEFHALGLTKSPQAWNPPSKGYCALAVAPFVTRTALDTVGRLSWGDRVLVSRQEELDKLPEDALTAWQQVFVLSDAAQGEAEDGPVGSDEMGQADTVGTAQGDLGTGSGPRPLGLHAKMIAVEHGWYVTWSVGSANLTAPAFTGSNVEMMASITGKKGGKNGRGIGHFLDGGFRELCVPYQRTEPEEVDLCVSKAEVRLDAARDALADAELRVVCVPGDDLWTLTVEGDVQFGADICVVAWPVSVGEDQALGLPGPLQWKLPLADLTAFIGFRLSVGVQGVDDIRMALRLPAEGLPEDRMHHVLRGLLDSPGKFLRFLRALLGGIDQLVGWTRDDGNGNSSASWEDGFGSETLLDDLVRTASRNPERLVPVRRLLEDLRKTEEGRHIVPDDFFAVWVAVEEALAREPRP